MANALIGAKEEDLVQTFKKFEKEQDKDELSHALADVAKVQEHIPKVATCLRTVVDPFPNEMSHVSNLCMALYATYPITLVMIPSPLQK